MSEISRVRRSKETARQSYDKMSRWYDLFASSEKKFAEMGISMLTVRFSETVLEIGFGTGHTLLDLARLAATTPVHGIDLSPSMRVVTEKKLARAGFLENVILQTGDAAHLPYKSDTFDVIFISFTLELFDTPEIPQVLGECRRVLKTGGRLGVVALEKQDCHAVRIYEWFHQRMPSIIDCRPIYAQASLEEAGFSIAKSKILKMWGLPISVLVAIKNP